MKQVSELMGILGQHFDWNKARLDCFIRMLLGLFVSRTVNLSEIAVVMGSDVKIDSRYRRLRRFFAECSFNYDAIARFIFSLFFKDKEIYLAIDRTNWFWGKAKINILTLAIAYEGVAIPLFWCLLNKAGCANAKEHQTIIERFIKVFGCKNIVGILADREFASGSFFHFLNKNKLPFYIRIKDGSDVKIKTKKLSSAKKLFRHLKPKERDEFKMAIWLYEQKVYLAGSRSEKGELMIVATNQNPTNAIAIYLRRWEIETLFSCLKGRGFRFEETHLANQERIAKMMALLAIGFCWAHKVGEWQASMKPIRMCQHRTSLRPQSSYFRYGLDSIRDLLTNPFAKITSFRLYLAVFLTEPPSLEATS